MIRLLGLDSSIRGRSAAIDGRSPAPALNVLLERRFIYPHHREGRQILYCASEAVRIIRDVPEQVEAMFG